jgi:DENN (AEX-3) domain
MLRIAQSYKRLTVSDPEFYAPIHPPNLLTLAENIANISINSINPLENL